jgi:hypothetical protein
VVARRATDTRLPCTPARLGLEAAGRGDQPCSKDFFDERDPSSRPETALKVEEEH